MKTDQEKIDFYNSHFEDVENPDEWISMAKKFEDGLRYAEVLHGIGNFLTEVMNNKSPMLTQICDANLGGDAIVSLWASIGNHNPIERLRELKNQIAALKEFINKISQSDYSVTEIDRVNIKLFNDFF